MARLDFFESQDFNDERDTYELGLRKRSLAKRDFNPELDQFQLS